MKCATRTSYKMGGLLVHSCYPAFWTCMDAKGYRGEGFLRVIPPVFRFRCEDCSSTSNSRSPAETVDSCACEFGLRACEFGVRARVCVWIQPLRVELCFVRVTMRDESQKKSGEDSHQVTRFSHKDRTYTHTRTFGHSCTLALSSRANHPSLLLLQQPRHSLLGSLNGSSRNGDTHGRKLLKVTECQLRFNANCCIFGSSA